MKEIVEINHFFRNQLWLDFALYTYQPNFLIFGAGENLTYHHDFEFVFHFPQAVIGRLDFKTSPKEFDTISVIEGDEAISINKKHHITTPCNLYKIKHDDAETIIVAEGFEVRKQTVLYYKPAEKLETGIQIAHWL
jgi:hypothetical protein